MNEIGKENTSRTKKLETLKNELVLVFLLIGLILLIRIFLFVRFIHLKTIDEFTKSIGPISPNSLSSEITKEKTIVPDKTENPLERLLAYKGKKLIPVSWTDIAYIRTEYKISYITRLSGEVLNCSLTLEEIFNQLDKHRFYRANRQYILSIASVSKVTKYGNTNLKLVLTPSSPTDIIISKAKAADFKRWLGKG